VPKSSKRGTFVRHGTLLRLGRNQRRATAEKTALVGAQR
jgi:hypothetical protein